MFRSISDSSVALSPSETNFRTPVSIQLPRQFASLRNLRQRADRDSNPIVAILRNGNGARVNRLSESSRSIEANCTRVAQMSRV